MMLLANRWSQAPPASVSAPCWFWWSQRFHFWLAWRRRCRTDELHTVSRGIQPLSVHLGALGMTGRTAWAGLNLVDVKAGDVIFISGAASGTVGNVAGQLAKLRGCRVIGSAGSTEKVNFLLEECGFDIAFNYKAGPMLEQLNQKAPDGIDVYFDNVGGETLEAAISALHIFMAESSPAAAFPGTTMKSRGLALPTSL